MVVSTYFITSFRDNTRWESLGRKGKSRHDSLPYLSFEKKSYCSYLPLVRDLVNDDYFSQMFNDVLLSPSHPIFKSVAIFYIIFLCVASVGFANSNTIPSLKYKIDIFH